MNIIYYSNQIPFFKIVSILLNSKLIKNLGSQNRKTPQVRWYFDD
jgi:hypothetical protein